MIDTEFVELFDDGGNNITSEVKSLGDPSDRTFSRGYKVARFLKGREDEVYAILTERLSEIQSILGFSVSQQLKDAEPGWMRVQPIFGKPSGSLSSDIFVLMPFQSDFQPIYDDHIRGVCKDISLECKRADDIFGSSKIISDVWDLIANSKIIIAECTGRNPNVFYELGIAHTIGQPVVIITQSEDDIPFDIRHIRYIKYNYTPRGMKMFESDLRMFLLEEIKKHA